MIPWNLKTRPWICVITVRGGEERYLGTCLNGAAEALVSGTCYATGVTQGQAQRMAQQERLVFLQANDAIAGFDGL